MTESVSGRKKLLILFASTIAVLFALASSESKASERKLQKISLSGIPMRYVFDSESSGAIADTIEVAIDGKVVLRCSRDKIAREGVTLAIERKGLHELELRSCGFRKIERIRTLPAWISILPPLVAIAVALFFRQVVVALLAGIWLGNFFLVGFDPLAALLRIVDHDAVEVLSNAESGADHVSIVVFTLLLGGMVGILYKMGGMQGIVDRISRIATNARRGQIASWIMGVAIFFDDYANTLIVGNSLRPLTDRLRISREKLAYIVDSTAAPVTSIAIITSWVGFQISLIGQAFLEIGVDRNPFAAFVSAIPYSFYPILSILFVLAVALLGRDFGPMLGAERRARSSGKIAADGAVPLSGLDARDASPADGAKPRALNGIVPIAVVIAVAFYGLLATGANALASRGQSFGLIAALREANSFTALLWCSMAGCLVAGLLAITQRLLKLAETVEAWLAGMRAMLIAIVILILAWCIGAVCAELHTADYLVHVLTGVLDPRFLPAVVFAVAMAISFSTGTSWGTMSILTPIVVPLAFGTARAAGIEGLAFDRILSASIAAILSGAVFGDHCSPISDTTIMSSMASACDHVDHVRTQLPYASTAAALSLAFGYLPIAFGLPVGVSIAITVVAISATLIIFGKRVEGESV